MIYGCRKECFCTNCNALQFYWAKELIRIRSLSRTKIQNVLNCSNNSEKKNFIRKIIGENGMWLEDQNIILQAFLKEFFKRYKNDPNVNIQVAIPLSRDMSSGDYKWLIRELTTYEVWQGAKLMGPLKILGQMVCMPFLS